MATVFTQMADYLELGDQTEFNKLVGVFESENPKIAQAIESLSLTFNELIKLSKQKGKVTLRNELDRIFGNSIYKAARILCNKNQIYVNSKNAISLIASIVNHTEDKPSELNTTFPQFTQLRESATTIVQWALANTDTRVTSDTKYGKNDQIYRTNAGGASATAPKPLI